MTLYLCSPSPKIISAVDRFLIKPMDYPWFLVDQDSSETAKQNKQIVCHKHKNGKTFARVCQAALTVEGPWGEENTTCLIGQCPDCKTVYWNMSTKYNDIYKYDEEYHSLWN